MSYHLKFVKAASYYGCGGKVQATRQKPDLILEDKAVVDKALATGYFKLLEETEVPPEHNDEPQSGKTLEEMTVSELETFATYKGVSLKGVKGKENMIAKLKEELGAEETENEVDYGSPTMTELQEQ